jgi:N utilization substance protein B
MAFSQQKFRELLFQLLYSSDFIESDEGDMADLMMRQLSVTKKVVRSAQDQLRLLCEKRELIDALIADVSKSYDFERIPRIERNILRLGVFELFFSSATPPKVAIAEAIRLTRKFSSAESAAFVNAILDGLYQSVVQKRSHVIQKMI